MVEDIKKSIKYWTDTAETDFKAAKSLFEKGLYPQCLFFCHLALEKLLKGLIVSKTKRNAPFIHDLRRLAEIANLDLDEKKQNILDEISVFNIAGRYAEEKFKFYKKYNKKRYGEKYLKITKELFLWLKKEFQKKQSK